MTNTFIKLVEHLYYVKLPKQTKKKSLNLDNQLLDWQLFVRSLCWAR